MGRIRRNNRKQINKINRMRLRNRALRLAASNCNESLIQHELA